MKLTGIVVLLVVPFINGSVFPLLGSFKVSNPAFASLFQSSGSRYDLLISTFSAIPFSTDTVQLVRDVGNYTKDVSSIKPAIITTKAVWPNEVAGVPQDVFHRPMAVVPYGFILPFKTNGGIALVDISDNATLPYNTNLITDDSTGQWFYHRVLWHDMNGDGLKDAVTCRAREPIFGSKASQLVWLEHPAGSVSSPWKPHVLMQGPDIFFRYVTLNTSTGPIDCIITAQFFTKSLSVYWTTDVNKDWTDPSKVKSRVIDNTIGGVFEVVVTDVNSDGKVDLLVTNNGNNGSVFVYEIPSDFRTGNFVRHIIATGFSPLHEGQGKGAPGALLPVFFQQGQKFPVILLSGDDNGSAYILQKKVPQSTDWSYLTVPFYTSGGDTLGEIAIADIDGDGFKEVVIPSYSTSEVVIFTSKNSTVQFP